MALHLSQIADADELLTNDPLALLIGMVLDQQIPLERAFAAPYELTRRLGRGLDPADLADADPDGLGKVFAQQPALHRYPGMMAKRVQKLCRTIVDTYDGDPSNVWRTAADGDELLRRVSGLPGFGAHKAKIFVALLGKQYGVDVPGWREAAGQFGEDGVHRSVADIIDLDSRDLVREHKQQMKAGAATKPKAAAATG